ncbi:MAG TPA: MATE family efflux transporter [Parachlamydiaceae bacterium]|nr:MATE family efflux transporter [Parachlamydiaceae bacterium]
MALTKHKEGSLRELWALSFPLMLSSFSVLMMVFSDRWFLAHYSTDAHNAAVAAMTFGWSFIFGWMSLAGISEVFVAQYTGAGLPKKIGEPVWQMIWVSVASWLFFIPLSLFGTELFFGSGVESAMEREYFSIMLLFGPFYVFYAALCGFFIGQGKTTLITTVVVAANLFNILMDWILIFGIEGWVPSFGVKGAAIATSLATLFQGLILGIVFLNAKNREEYGTSQWKPDFKAMMGCIKIGLPTSIFIVAEILAYGCYYMIMKDKGVVYITVAGVSQSMIILFFFFCEGINKATTAIVGNLVGAGRTFLIPKVIKSGLILNVLFFIFVMTLFVFGTSFVISQFLPLADSVFIEEIRPSLQMSLILFAVYIFLDGIRMQFGGVLTACGDTFFLLVSGASLVWILMWLPVYLFIAKGNAPVETGALISVCYCAVACLAYYWRIKRNQRQEIVSLVSVPVQD